MIFEISKIDPSMTTKRNAWVAYSPSKGFFVNYNEPSEGYMFSKVLQDAFTFDDHEAAKQFASCIKVDVSDIGCLKLKCSL